jgi:carbon monoxide dehydrogenase subunit G
MRLEQSFTVAAPLTQVWSTLIDIERVAPCLPGAEITGHDGEGAYTGNFTVKLGPTTAAYSGVLEMQSVDESTRTATMTARGTDKRGQGGATATIVSSAREADGQTTVDVVTDFTITGRLARFGRSGMIEDISNRLLRDFAECLQSTAGSAGPARADAGEPPPVTAGDVPAEAAGGAEPSSDPDRVGTLGVPPPSPPGRQPPATTGDADAAAERAGSPGVPPLASDDAPATRGAATPAPPPDAASPAPPPPSGGAGGDVGTAGGGGAPPPPPTGPPPLPGGRARHEEAAEPPRTDEPAEPARQAGQDEYLTQAPVAKDPAVRTESIPPPGRESPPSSVRPARPVKGLSLLGSVLLGRIRRLLSRRR